MVNANQVGSENIDSGAWCDYKVQWFNGFSPLITTHGAFGTERIRPWAHQVCQVGAPWWENCRGLDNFPL